jgi:hypothetical protein
MARGSKARAQILTLVLEPVDRPRATRPRAAADAHLGLRGAGVKTTPGGPSAARS